MKRIRWVSCLTLILLFLAACGNQETKKSYEPGKYPTEIPETTKISDEATRKNLASFDQLSGLMRFSQTSALLESLKPNDVLVSEPSELAPFGYLRKVKTIRKEGSEVVLETSQAALTEAVKTGSLNAEFVKLEPAALQNLEPSESLKIVDKSGRVLNQTNANLQIGDGLFYEFGIDKTVCPTNDCNTMSVGLKGALRFNAGYKIGIDIGFFSIDRFEAKMGIDQSINAGIVGKVSGNVQLGEPKIYELKRIPFALRVFNIGPLPVVVQPFLVINMRLDGKANVSFSWGVQQTLAYELGTLYDGDKWHDISQEGFNFSPNLSPDVKGNAKLKVLTEVEPYIKFYDSAGPYFGLAGGVSIDAAHPRTPSWILGAVIQCRVGVRADFKILGNLDYSAQVCSKEFEISRQANRPPIISQVPQGTNQVVAIKGVGLFLNGNSASFPSGSFQIKADDPEDGEDLSFSASSDKDGVFSQDGDLFKLAPKTLGIHAITVKVTDTAGLSTSSSFLINVTAGKPTVDAKVPTTTVIAGTQVSVSYSGQNGDSLELFPPALSCNQLSWSVSSPDEILSQSSSTTQTKCLASFRFNTPGARLLELTGTDNWGQKTSKSFAVSIQDAGPIVITYLKAKCNGIEVAEGGDCQFGQKVYASARATGPEGASLSYTWLLENNKATAPAIDLQEDITVPIGDATTSVSLPRKIGVVEINPNLCILTPDSQDFYNTLTLIVADSVNPPFSQSFHFSCSVPPK